MNGLRGGGTLLAFSLEIGNVSREIEVRFLCHFARTALFNASRRVLDELRWWPPTLAMLVITCSLERDFWVAVRDHT